VSFRLSPLESELPLLAREKVSADRRLAAMSKEVLVRVEGSAKKRTTVLPRSVGTFFTGRLLISWKLAAALKIVETSSRES